jgi:SAM-dependent methyltransferase
MAHQSQIDFCQSVREKFPTHFNNIEVLDIGSLDINGNNRYLFHKCRYLGIDIVEGKNVDKVRSCADHLSKPQYEAHYDVIISTEALEHDATWESDLQLMYWALKPGGLLLLTAAGDGRPEHGTKKHTPENSPGTIDYYCNISNWMAEKILKPSMFQVYYMGQDKKDFDFQFYGIKKL